MPIHEGSPGEEGESGIPPGGSGGHGGRGGQGERGEKGERGRAGKEWLTSRRLLAIYVLVTLAFSLVLWKVQGNTTQIAHNQRAIATEVKSDQTTADILCAQQQKTTQAIIDMNLALIKIDANGDTTDKALSAQRKRTVEALKPLVPTCEGLKP